MALAELGVDENPSTWPVEALGRYGLVTYRVEQLPTDLTDVGRDWHCFSAAYRAIVRYRNPAMAV